MEHRGARCAICITSEALKDPEAGEVRRQAMAMMELRAALAVLLSEFIFTLAPEAGSREEVLQNEVMSGTLHIRGGVKLRARPRTALHPSVA